jgi:predicted dehydrogenase
MKPVALGVIGCGVIGRHHLAAASRMPLIHIAAIADRIEERGREMAEQYNVTKRYVEGAELLMDPEVEAVVLAFPAAGRFPLAMQAFQRGIHVLTEKPVAMNAEEVRRMIAGRGKLVAGCCSSRYRFLPSADAVTQFIATGALGALRVVRARNIVAAGAPPVAPPPTWRLRRDENGGGILMNWGCYDLDFLLGITGWSLRPRTVLAQMWTLPEHFSSRAAPHSDAETHVTALICCEGGAAINYERGEFVAGRTESAWQIVGSLGTLHLTMTTVHTKTVAFDAADRERGAIAQTVWQGDEDAARVHDGPVQDFCAAIRAGKQPRTGLEQALIVQRISDAIYRSAQSGQATEVV